MSNCPIASRRQRMHVGLLYAHVAERKRVADQRRVGDVFGARIDREHVARAHLRELRREPALMARDIDDRALRDRFAESARSAERSIARRVAWIASSAPPS